MFHHTRILSLCPVAAWLLLAPVPGRAELGLGLSPMRIDVLARPGTAHSGALRLISEMQSPVRVRAEVFDFLVDANGTPQFDRHMASEEKWSCRDWVTVNPVEADIQPGQPLAARYTVRVPPGAEPREFHCAVGYTTLPTAEQVAGFGMRMAVRMVTAIYVKTGEARPVPAFGDLRVEQTGKGKDRAWQAVAVFRNGGTANFRPSGNLTVTGADGKVLETAEIPGLPILPEREQRLPIPLKTAPAGGRFVVKATVDLGTGELLEAVAQVEGEVAQGAANE